MLKVIGAIIEVGGKRNIEFRIQFEIPFNNGIIQKNCFFETEKMKIGRRLPEPAGTVRNDFRTPYAETFDTFP